MGKRNLKGMWFFYLRTTPTEEIESENKPLEMEIQDLLQEMIE